MINKDELNKIITNPDASPIDKINVIIKYIHDLKNIELDLNKINMPNNPHHAILLEIMYNVAANYYK